ncbi:hypothetical protein SNE40_021541 [Patella caerulea]|uniref:Uncharacterized protein n=1 Tax=Patella caerulea TaxID=87958 RepID=A0AAN8J4A9_PATCE
MIKNTTNLVCFYFSEKLSFNEGDVCHSASIQKSAQSSPVVTVPGSWSNDFFQGSGELSPVCERPTAYNSSPELYRPSFRSPPSLYLNYCGQPKFTAEGIGHASSGLTRSNHLQSHSTISQQNNFNRAQQPSCCSNQCNGPMTPVLTTVDVSIPFEIYMQSLKQSLESTQIEGPCYGRHSHVTPPNRYSNSNKIYNPKPFRPVPYFRYWESKTVGISTVDTAKCSKDFPVFQNSKDETQDAEKRYRCDVCFKGFSRSNTLITDKVCSKCFSMELNVTTDRQQTNTSITEMTQK